MNVRTLIEALGYDRSSSFLDRRSLLRSLDFAHVFRKAIDNCSLHGVYLLTDSATGARSAPTPVVYVAEAATDDAATEIHRLVWNQGVVPFLIVRTPLGVRVYSGFAYSRDQTKTDTSHTGILDAIIGFNDVVERLADFRAQAIDDGLVWKTWGAQMDPRRRVDWLLLDNLKSLVALLVESEGLKKSAAHALIGKFVYLRYLRDRDILSERKLVEWDLIFDACLGRHITPQGFERLNRHLDEWLNGAVFPLEGQQFETRHVQLVADVFLGDTPSRQLHLNFDSYDFSYIPIETLSVIYEQFLASENQSHPNGAFYTPIPVVNFILNEVEDRAELVEGVKVLDPSCGSGAFLVQCYRRLVERTILKKKEIPGPLVLRALLTKSIFGVDRDGDACRIAELSLLLTMLDYIDPPDLHNTRFKLPTLRGSNVYESDFFDPDSEWAACRASKFDVIIGNPPWVEASSSDEHVLAWMRSNKNTRPVVENQTAEAFLWRATDYLTDEGTAGFLIPAATLFKDSSAFRRSFFERHHVASVANLASFRRVLFRNVEAAAAAIVYGKAGNDEQPVYAFSPLLANQEAARSPVPGKRRDIWSISVNASEVQVLDRREISTGSSLPWKVAMWGSVRDLRLLQKLGRDFPTLGGLEKEEIVWMSEGLQLRKGGSKSDVDEVPEVVDKAIVDTKALKNHEHIFSFPAGALGVVAPENGYARKGRRDIPLSVCHPPHIVVAASGNFFVFTDRFVVIPPRWIGIAAAHKRAELLRALSVYLSSYVVIYHQFFISSQQGIRDGRLQLATLRRVPIPRESFEGKRLKEWTALHRELVHNEEQTRRSVMSDERLAKERTALLKQLNSLAYKALGLREDERCLVRDFVEVKIGLSDGVLRPEALRPPHRDELTRYANRLATSLDVFLGDDRRIMYQTCIAYSPYGGAVEVKAAKRGAVTGSSVVSADDAMRSQLLKRARLSGENAQWLYFDRNLFVSRGDSVYIFKPMQRSAWTEAQALLDADELIANTLLEARD